jgi:hypothetical protein
MRYFKNIRLPFMLSLMLVMTLSFTEALAQESGKEYNLTGIWERDDGKTRTLEHVEGGILMTTEGREYLYRKIGENVYQMDWTASSYGGGKYRWTLHVVNDTQVKNYYETASYKSRTPKIYMRMVI